MWSLETLQQINAKHAELGRDGGPVDAREVYRQCGIRVLGDTHKAPGVDPQLHWDVVITGDLTSPGETHLFVSAHQLIREANEAIMQSFEMPPQDAKSQLAADYLNIFTRNIARSAMGLPPLPMPGE